MREANKADKAIIAFWGLTLLAVLLFATLRVQAIVPFGWRQDEGAHLTSSIALSEGHRLFSDTEVLLCPGLLEFLGLVFRVFAPSLHLARLTCIGLAASYLVVVAVTGRRLSNRVGGIVAMALLASDQGLFKDAGHVLSDIPALCVVSVSVMLAMIYLTTGKRGHLCGAALFCGVHLLVKPLVPFLPLWLALAVAAKNWPGDPRQPGRRWPSFVGEGLLAFAAFCLPLAAGAVMYDNRAWFETAYLAPVRLREHEVWCPGCNVTLIVAYLRGYGGALLLVGLGTIWALMRARWLVRTLLLLWSLLIIMLFFLWLHAPLFSRHCVILSLPLTLLAGISVSSLISSSVLREHRLFWSAGVLAAALALALAAFNVADLNKWARDGARYGQGGSEVAAIALLQAATTSSEVFASDDLILAYYARRRVPPQFSDVSHARNLSGHLTPQHVIQTIEDYDIQAVCFWTKRFDDLPMFVDWAKTHFADEQEFGKGRRILYGRRYDRIADIPGLVAVPNAALKDSISLVGYRLTPFAPRPGEEARLTLYWQSLARPRRDYQVFVHLTNAQGTPIAQADSAPVHGLCTTSRWRRGEILADVHALMVPADAPSGDYRLLVGMYAPTSMQRLPLVGTSEDAIVLTTLHLMSGPTR